MIPSTLIPLLIGMIITYVNTNQLSVEDYGILSVLNNLITLISTIFFSFIIQSFLRFYSIYKNEKGEQQYKTLFFWLLTLMLLPSLTFIVPLKIIFNYDFKIIIIILINAFALNLFGLVLNDFRCAEKLKKYNIYRVGNSILKLLLIFILYKFSKTPFSYLLATAFSFLLLCTPFIVENFKFKFDKFLFKESIKFGLPLIGTNISYLLLSTFDRYMIIFFQGDVEVAYYSFAYQLSELSLININGILMVVFYPKILKCYDQCGRNETEFLISKLFNFHIIILMTVSNIIIIFSKDFTNLFFRKYIGTEMYMILIVIGVFIYCTSFYTNKAFEVEKKSLNLLFITLCSASMNILLNLYFIPKYGSISATITTIVSYLFYIMLSSFFGKKYLSWKIDKIFLFKIIFINIIILIIFNIINEFYYSYSISFLFIKICIFIILFCILYILFKIKLHNEEIKF